MKEQAQDRGGEGRGGTARDLSSKGPKSSVPKCKQEQVLSPAMGEISFIPPPVGFGNLVRRDNVWMGRGTPGSPGTAPSNHQAARPGPCFRLYRFCCVKLGNIHKHHSRTHIRTQF